MRQGFKEGHAADTLILGMTTDFRDTTADEILLGKDASGAIMLGEAKRITRKMGR